MSKPVSLDKELEIAVFARGQRTQSIPAFRMDRVGAQYQVDCGFARWVNNRYNSILMLVEAANFKARDRSSQMGPRIIELAAMGNHAALALVAGWKPYLVPARWINTASEAFHVNLNSEMDALEAEQAELAA
jgi:hypothetical protein